MIKKYNFVLEKEYKMGYTEKQKSFLQELQQLLRKYNASIHGGGNDDGYLEIDIAGESVICLEDGYKESSTITPDYPDIN